MSSTESLQQAICAARAGRKEEARHLLLEIVEADPRNEMAWMWLAGLVDSLEDQMIACENALAINPANEKAQAYLAELQRRKSSFIEENVNYAESLLAQAKAHAQRNEMDVALDLARQAVKEKHDYEEAWLLIGRISPVVDERLTALEKANQLNPSNRETVSALKQARYLKANPLSAAVRLEQMGKLEEALAAYQELAARARNSKEFDHIYRQIIRIEGLKKENIRHVATASSIARLTFGWPLLYLSLALVQTGLNPFAHPTFYLWLGLPFVILGSFLLSLAEVRSKHVLWEKLFDEHGEASTFARLVAATAGWFFVLVPHILIVFDSLNRLHNFTIPPMPF
jgi:tetratricopeptide (TPR) repeat protein